MPGRIIAAILLTVVIFHAVAFAVYGTWSAVTGLQPSAAGDSPGLFMLGVALQKLGHSIAFVLLFYVARETFSRQWLTYAALWWTYSAIAEMGEAITPAYTFEEALAGTVAEAVYFPLAAWVTKRLIGASGAGSDDAIRAGGALTGG